MHVGKQGQGEGSLGVTLAVGKTDGLLAIDEFAVCVTLLVVGVVVDGNIMNLRLNALVSQRQHAGAPRHTESLPVERNDVEVVGRTGAQPALQRTEAVDE